MKIKEEKISRCIWQKCAHCKQDFLAQTATICQECKNSIAKKKRTQQKQLAWAATHAKT